MRLAIVFFVLLAGSFCLSAPHAVGAEPPQADTEDAKRLEGTWKVVALETDGRKAPPEAIKGMRWSIKGAEVEFTDGDKSAGKATMKLDPAKTPKHMDLAILEGPHKGQTKGIYKLEKDRLVVCVCDADKGRPKESRPKRTAAWG